MCLPAVAIALSLPQPHRMRRGSSRHHIGTPSDIVIDSQGLSRRQCIAGTTTRIPLPPQEISKAADGTDKFDVSDNKTWVFLLTALARTVAADGPCTTP